MQHDNATQTKSGQVPWKCVSQMTHFRTGRPRNFSLGASLTFIHAIYTLQRASQSPTKVKSSLGIILGIFINAAVQISLWCDRPYIRSVRQPHTFLFPNAESRAIRSWSLSNLQVVAFFVTQSNASLHSGLILSDPGRVSRNPGIFCHQGMFQTQRLCLR